MTSEVMGYVTKNNRCPSPKTRIKFYRLFQRSVTRCYDNHVGLHKDSQTLKISDSKKSQNNQNYTYIQNTW